MSVFFVIAAVALCMTCGWLEADVYFTQPQAIHVAFQNDTVERKTLFLTPDQIEKIETLSRTKVDSSIISYYVAYNGSGITGTAFFDRRVVRTLPVTYMTVVKPSGAIDRVEILSFDEPNDYLPPARWLALYKNQTLGNDLAVGRSIPYITGASLSSQAMNDGIRQMLAIYRVGVLNHA